MSTGDIETRRRSRSLQTRGPLCIINIFAVDNQLSSIIDIFCENLTAIKNSKYMEIVYLIIGAILGFSGSYLNYRISEKKKFKESLETLTIDLNILAEEIVHNMFAIRINSYVNENHLKQIELKGTANRDSLFHNGESQKLLVIIGERLKDRELLSARLSGKIQEFNLLLGKSEEVDRLFLEYKSYNVSSKYFDNADSLVGLENALYGDFNGVVKKEMEEVFAPKLYRLIFAMKNEAYRKIGKSELIAELKT